MEKQGVCPGENEDPKLVAEPVIAGGITREMLLDAAKVAASGGCCKAPRSCGDDPISRAADAVADKK